ncbi:MAG: DUF1684 domain-containing protein [Candidatus Aminicenantes bacterium]|nr:DUF1684 domain-containing protein [Candidatus Aminicenantes bacterium]
MGKGTGKRIILSALSAFFLASMAPAPLPAGGDDAWRQELLKERALKDVEFKTSVTSPMAGRERLTIPAGEKSFVMVLRGEVSISAQAGEGAVFSLLFRRGEWFWDDAAPGIECRSEVASVATKNEALPAGCLLRVGDLNLAAYPGSKALALIVFDPKRPQQVEFEHLLYFPPDPRYAVKARLERFPEPPQMKVTTTRKLEKTFYRFGRVHFRLEGKELSLAALKSSLEGPDSGYLFIPFKDATNGDETYEVGRFIDMPEPSESEFILDFNRCYNPLCNYSPAYNCPMPPLENILKVGVPAGEKTYPH